MIDNTNETTALILSGQGYELTIAPDAVEKKTQLIATASAVTLVTSNDESGAAQRVSRSLAAMRIEVEKARKIVKEPVNRIGKLIDQTAKDFVADIDAEEKRITKLVGAHAEEVARLKRIKEAEERRAFEEARAAREAAEAAAAAAENTGKIADVISAKQAEAERVASLAARMDASAEVATTKIADGVRFAWDFEVTDIDLLARAHRELVTIEARRADILAKLKDAAVIYSDEVAMILAFDAIGLRVFQKPVVSSR